MSEARRPVVHGSVVQEAVFQEGLVRESLPGVLFRVELKGGQMVTAHIGHELRMHVVRILPGMEVIVEMSAFDLGRGRIVKRI